ncbi:MAG: hypothetical protein ACYCWW_04875 [Deltaproteobacteria bacterium]
MPQTAKKNEWGHFVQSHLHDLQKDAERVFGEIAARGRDSRKELDRLIARIEKAGWAEKPAELADKAKELGAELAGHLDDLQTKAIRFAGVASRDQVEALTKEISKLGAKVENLAKDLRKKARVGQA